MRIKKIPAFNTRIDFQEVSSLYFRPRHREVLDFYQIHFLHTDKVE